MKTEKKCCTAIVLAAGSGKRMGSVTAKQFMLLDGKPVIWYSLQAVEQSEIIDDCILVTGAEDIAYARREIVEKYKFRKVKRILAGGSERCKSVYRALCAIEEEMWERDGYVFIHDGARPFLTEEILQNTYREVCVHHACAAAVPVKDTIKMANEDGFVTQTPDRSRLWAMQTPQVFETELIIRGYQKLFEEGNPADSGMTDDAMVAEKMLGVPVKLVMGSYENIKITTPEDMGTAMHIIAERRDGFRSFPQQRQV